MGLTSVDSSGAYRKQSDSRYSLRASANKICYGLDVKWEAKKVSIDNSEEIE